MLGRRTCPRCYARAVTDRTWSPLKRRQADGGNKAIVDQEVLIDLGADPTPEGGYANPMIVHVEDALRWVATGQFSEQVPPAVQGWIQVSRMMDHDYKWEREAGRLDLAAELVGHAIDTNSAHRGVEQ